MAASKQLDFGLDLVWLCSRLVGKEPWHKWRRNPVTHGQSDSIK